MIEMDDEELQEAMGCALDRMAARVNALESRCQELADEKDMLEKRLAHLLESRIVRDYDEVEPFNGGYKRDISLLDEAMKLGDQSMRREVLLEHKIKELEACIVRFALLTMKEDDHE